MILLNFKLGFVVETAYLHRILSDSIEFYLGLVASLIEWFNNRWFVPYNQVT